MDCVFIPIEGNQFISYYTFDLYIACCRELKCPTLVMTELVHILGKRTGLDYFHMAEHGRGKTSILR